MWHCPCGTEKLVIGCIWKSISDVSASPPVLKLNSADELGMCCGLWEGRWELHNYADLLPTATSGHVLTDIPKLLNDAHWGVFSSCVCLHYLSFFLSSQSYANTLKNFSDCCCESAFFFPWQRDNNRSFQPCECLFFFFFTSSRFNKIIFSSCSVFGCVASNFSKYLTAQLQLLMLWCCVAFGIVPQNI